MENGVLGTKQRDTYLDIAKAIGILMVIYAHVSLSGILYTTFYAFHIPLFFVVAGMTFNNKKHTSFKTFTANKAKRLLLPYLIYSLATFAWWAWVEVPISGTLGGAGKTIFDSFIQIFLAQGSLGYMTHNLALWFVPCLFIAEIIYYFVNKLSKATKITICVAFALLGWGINILGQTHSWLINLPWSLEVAFSAQLFILIGDLMGSNGGRQRIREHVTKFKIPYLIAIPFACVALYCIAELNINTSALIDPFAFAEMRVSMGSNALGNPLLFYFNAMLGVWIVLIISVLLERLVMKRAEYGNSVLLWLGVNSYGLMCVHFPVKRRAIAFIADLFRVSSSYASYDLLYSFLAFIVTMLFSVIIVVVSDAFKQAISIKEFRE